MCSDVLIRCERLGKAYRRYQRPGDRLKEAWLRKRYGRDFWALRDVDVEVRRGETLGIIGRNGAGKSTLLQLICGILQPTQGTVELRGRVAAMLELGAGFDPDFTGRENVELSAAVMGLSRSDISARFPAIEAFAGIGEFIDRPVRHYSSGMFARLAFAVCAHVDADIMIVDEILAVGDAAFRQKCMRFLHQFRAQGTLLFVSHDEGAVLTLCQRALWLDGGLQRELGPSREVCARYLASMAEAEMPGTKFHRNDDRPFSPPQERPPAADQPDRARGFDFDPEEPWEGQGGAAIEQVVMSNREGVRLDWASGGQDVQLRIACRADRPLRQPVVGFVLRNRFGIHLFGDDTHETYSQVPDPLPAGERFVATFCFQLPLLPAADYSIETFLLEAGPDGYEPLDRLIDAHFLQIMFGEPSSTGSGRLTVERTLTGAAG